MSCPFTECDGRVVCHAFSAVGARVGHLDTTDTAALLVKTLTHDRLAIQGDNLAIELAFFQ